MDCVLESLRLDEKLPDRTKINPDHSLPEISAITQTYFSMLNLTDVESLYKIYKNDFIMFNYSFDFQGKQFPESEIF